MSNPLRIVFMGSDPIALPFLEWLSSRVVAVFTQPDRAVGRGQKVVPNAIKTWALAQGLPVHQPGKFDEEARVQLAACSADVALVMAYGHILRQDVIDTPRLGTLNLHASVLPGYRGASPIQTAIASGERETGVSLMRIVRQLDAGPVADVERVAIAPHDTALDIEAKLAAACLPLLARTLPALAADTLVFREQNHAAATFCRRLVKDDGVLDFAAPAGTLAARINGLHPWPSCRVEMAGETVKIGLAAAIEGSAAPGRVERGGAEGLIVGTGHGFLRLLQLQRPGGKMLPAGDFLRGFPLPPGTQLPSQPMPILVGPVPFR